MKYSQNDEQHYIETYFKAREPRHGRKFLDIGAFDGKTFSNTFALLEHGWSGVLVEASPTMFTAMQRNLTGYDCHLCLACIVTEPVTGMITFYDNDQATATTSQAHVGKWQGQTPFRPITVMPVHYKAITGYYGASFDFVSIDIEGQSSELFLKILAEMPDVDLWAVEHDERRDEIIAAAGEAFAVLYSNGENLILGRK